MKHTLGAKITHILRCNGTGYPICGKTELFRVIRDMMKEGRKHFEIITLEKPAQICDVTGLI